MPNKDNKILKCNYGEKSLKVLVLFMVTYSVCLKTCTHVKMILKNLIQRKKLSIYLLVIHCLQIVHLVQQKTLDCYRGKDFMERFCKDLRQHAIKIIDYEK